tara:strand:+ start:5482 stop:6414 length:933 start_codon:yes stop_codon:yes gene_type:complete
MNSYLFLPCNNGLGHIRRLSILANNINFTSKKIFFLLDKKKKIKFQLDKRIKKIFFLNYNLEKLNKKLDFNNFTKIISDNEINKKIIFDKKKNFIFANFFWEEILNKRNGNIKNLKKKGIKVFSNYLFSNIKANVKIKKIGFFEKFKPNKNNGSILIAVGSAKSRLLAKFKIKILKLLKKNLLKKKKIYLDPQLYISDLKKFNVHKADFSEKMYSNVSFAIVKPGLGTIEECLKRGIIIFPCMEKENKEFEYNAHVLIKKKLGFKFNRLERIFKFIDLKFNDNKFQNLFKKKCKKLKWNGEIKIKEYLEK